MQTKINLRNNRKCPPVSHDTPPGVARRISRHFQRAKLSRDAGFPLSSTGRGIEGWELARRAFVFEGQTTLSPLIPVLSPLRGEEGTSRFSRQ